MMILLKEIIIPENQIGEKLNYTKQSYFEITAVIITALLKFILMDWLDWRAFYITVVIISWMGYIFYKVKTDKKILMGWGLKKEHFKQSILFLAPFIFVTLIASLIYNALNESVSFSWQFILILLLYPFWGIIQQFIMLGIVSRNLATISKVKYSRYLTIFLVSILFSSVHYTNLFLMVFAFFLELIFSIVYLRWQNLWAIGIAHGWVATFVLYFVLNRNLWSELFAIF